MLIWFISDFFYDMGVKSELNSLTDNINEFFKTDYFDVKSILEILIDIVNLPEIKKVIQGIFDKFIVLNDVKKRLRKSELNKFNVDIEHIDNLLKQLSEEITPELKEMVVRIHKHSKVFIQVCSKAFQRFTEVNLSSQPVSQPPSQATG